jgi:CRISPR-associated endonuclease/helicase Cas3
MRQTFEKQFDWLTGHPPYLWQSEIFQAAVENRIPAALALGTGSGKTSLIPIWLLALLQQQTFAKTTLPRRLVWVINRRAVVDQATEIAERIAQKFSEPSELRTVLDSMSVTGGLGVSTLRGEHEDNQEWSEDPSRPSIIVGTVDMVGSRLLLVGYGLSTRQRAQDAGLLGNDVLLVNDEAQLSPAFAALVRKIETARLKAEIPLLKPFVTMHVSATLDASSTTTGVFRFDMDSEPSEHFQKIYRAKKTLELRTISSRSDKVHEMLGAAIRTNARRVTVMVDTPTNARKVAASIRNTAKTKTVLTMTGTMRGYERDALTKNPLFAYFTSSVGPPEQVWLVCTSAGESGIDMSCDLMITDFVAAERLIQRFGRLNRFDETTGKAVLFYSNEDVQSQRGAATLAYLQSLNRDISCRNLSKNPPPQETCSPRPDFANLHDWDLQLLSYTSIRNNPYRPAIDSLLHGEEGDPPYTDVAWRAEAEYLLQADPEDVEEWLNIARVRSHEKLSEHTNIVLDLLRDCKQQAIVRESAGDVIAFNRVKDFRNALIILPPGVLGLSSGMLTTDNDGAPFDVADNKGTRFVRKGEKFFQLGSESGVTEDQFESFLKHKKMTVLLSINAGEDIELIYVRPKPSRKANNGQLYLDDHLTAVEQNVLKLAGALALPADLTDTLALAARLHDIGKEHPNWQRAFGNTNGARPIAKLAKGRRSIRQNILGGLRHEFVSVMESASEGPLALQLVASHHKWGRPHFPERGYDRRRASEENRRANLANMKRFVELEKRFGIWGLAYLECILRAADAQASG